MRATAGRNAEDAAELSKVRGVRVLDLDISSNRSVEGTVQTILSESGRIDDAVNNAGFGTFGITEAFTVEQWETVFVLIHLVQYA